MPKGILGSGAAILASLSALAVALLPRTGGGVAHAQPPQPTVERRLLPLRCEVSCSETKVGTAVAKLVWSNAEPTRAAAGIERTAMGQPTVQTTVHKNGFDRNQYATFSRVDTKKEEMRPEAVGAIPGERVRAYDLRLVEFDYPEPSASFTAEEPRGSEAFVLVENLEPGLNYVWRLRFPRDSGFFETQTVTCEAPVCPADRPQED